MTIFLYGTQLIQGRLVQTYHGSQGTGDQVQFVLYHQVRREQSFYRQLAATARIAWPIETFFVMAVHPAEERAHRPSPWQGGKLVHSGNDEARQPPVDRLIHRYNGQGPPTAELAIAVDA